MNGWYSVTIFWSSGEIQTIWVKDEGVAWAIANDIIGNEDVKKVKVSSGASK